MNSPKICIAFEKQKQTKQKPRTEQSKNQTFPLPHLPPFSRSIYVFPYVFCAHRNYVSMSACVTNIVYVHTYLYKISYK